MSYFTTARNVELSLLDYLETEINRSWSGITIVKTFNQAYSKDTDLPIVCARLLDQTSTRLEIGSDTLDNRYGLVIDIFATSDGQRIDLADFILDKLKDGWIYHIFSQTSGSPTTLDTTPSGRCRVMSFIDNRRVDLGDNVDKKDRHRHTLSILVRMEAT